MKAHLDYLPLVVAVLKVTHPNIIATVVSIHGENYRDAVLNAGRNNSNHNREIKE